MQWSAFPSLNSLRAFAVLAETQSYSDAGATLSISHSAVTQHVKALEAQLGVQLVVRQGREFKLTDDGAALAWHLARGFSAMQDGLETLSAARASRPIQITMPPAFAGSWLLPRLPDFQARNPDLTLMLNPTAQLIEPTPGGIDLAIRFGNGQWRRLQVIPFLSPDMLVVGARELVGKRKIATPRDLAELPWLQELGTDEVADWMKRHGVIPRHAIKICHMPGNLIMDAVRRGDGLTYTARCFVDDDLRSGRLIELSAERNVGRYYIVVGYGALRPAVKALVKWLKQQSDSH